MAVNTRHRHKFETLGDRQQCVYCGMQRRRTESSLRVSRMNDNDFTYWHDGAWRSLYIVPRCPSDI